MSVCGKALWDWASGRRGTCFFFLCCCWKGHCLGGILPLQKLELLPVSDLSGAMFLEQGGQIKHLGMWHLGCTLPALVNTSKQRGAVLVLGENCLACFVTRLEIASYGACCCCLWFEVSLVRGLYGARFPASPLLRM